MYFYLLVFYLSTFSLFAHAKVRNLLYCMEYPCRPGYAGGLAAIMLGLRPKEQSMAIAWLAAAAAFVLELPGRSSSGSSGHVLQP